MPRDSHGIIARVTQPWAVNERYFRPVAAIAPFTSQSGRGGSKTSSSLPSTAKPTTDSDDRTSSCNSTKTTNHLTEERDEQNRESKKANEESVQSGDAGDEMKGNQTPTTKNSRAPSLFPRHLRRLIVRRNDIYFNSKNKNSSTSQTDLQQLVGTYKRTPVAQSEILDSFGQLILKPASVSSKSFRHYLHQEDKFDNSNNAGDTLESRPLGVKNEFFVGKTQFSTNSLPLLNVAVMLDPTKYVKSMDASMVRSGTEAARRILRGRKEWYRTVRKHAERGLDPSSIPLWPNNLSYPTDSMNRRASYRLTGHGVPRELLQDHIDYAGALLSQNQATSVTLASRDSIRVRRPDGSHHNVQVPENSHSLDLYMAVMERISKTLSIVLHREPYFTQRPHSPTPASEGEPLEQPESGIDPNGDNDSHAATTDRPSSGPSDMPMWHVEFTRGWVVAEPTVNQLEPVVEWVWPRQIFIRLRGRPKNNPRMAVALAYDATFPTVGKRL